MPRERFNYQDAGLVNFDRDTFPHNIGSVGIFEGDIPFARYLPHVDERLDMVPRYRERMVRAPFDLSTPVWHDDPHFDIGHHVRLVTLPEPGSEAQLRHLAGEFFAEPLDRERPLWKILLVRGLSGGRTAQLVKAHHCLVDGVGGVQLLIALLDATPQPAHPKGVSKRPPRPLPGPLVRLVDGVCDQLLDQIDAAESFALALVDPASAMRRARSVAQALWAAGPYLRRRAPDTPWNTKLSGPRHLAWQQVPLAETREICSALGGKVNDLVLTALAGALRRYFLLHEWDTEGVVLRVAVPVNVRHDADARSLGNHVSIVLAGLPLGVADPRARFQVISREMKELKRVDQAAGIEHLLRFLSRLPAPVQAGLGSRLSAPNIFTNLLCTNVRGPETPLYCLGHEMVAHYPWVLTTWRMGLGVAVMTYMKDVWFSFTGDAGVLSDVDRIADFLAEDFWELHATVAKRAVARRGALRAVASPARAEPAAAAHSRRAAPPAKAVTVAPSGNNGHAPRPGAAPAGEPTGQSMDEATS
jgi:WS/DGAT/MGAT family acyltransferase